ncbi:MAG TPA: hypothetical protein VNQ73_08790 [Ilumatobacter sp.]|nr:hypothetical protein [Ilumatobacter sp.]
MITVLSSPKPGTGVSTTAALLALAVRHGAHTHVVDLAGDQRTLLGATHTADVVTPVTERLTVHDLTDADLGAQLDVLHRLARLGEHVIVDAGPATHPIHDRLPAGTVRRWVLRPCYLTLRRATATDARPDEVILLEELGRALTARDVEAVTAAPVTATIEVHPQIARIVDAGLLTARPPAGALATLETLTRSDQAATR